MPQQEPHQSFEEKARDYISEVDPLELIDVENDWSEKELELYLKRSELLLQDTSIEDKEMAEEDKATTKKLTQAYHDALDTSKETSPEGQKERIRRSGIKTKSDFLTFINSPAGKGVKTTIALEIKKQQLYKEQRQFAQVQKARRTSLIRKILLFLIFIEYLEEKAYAAEINAENDKESIQRIEEQNDEDIDATHQAATERYNELLREKTEEASGLLEENNALHKEANSLDDKIDQLKTSIPQLDEKTKALDNLNTLVQKELAENSALHNTTDSLLQPDVDKTVDALQAHTKTLEAEMDHLRDEQAKFGMIPEGIDNREARLSAASLEDSTDLGNKQKQITLECRLQDLKEDHEIVLYETHKVNKAPKLADILKQFVLINEEGIEIPVLPELPPHMLKQRTEHLCDVAGDDLLNQQERDHIDKHKIHPRDILQRWLPDKYRFYDEDCNHVPTHEKHDRAAFMVPRHKRLIEHQGVKYIVPENIRTVEDLEKMPVDDLLAAKREATENRYRPAKAYFRNCVHRSMNELDDAKLSLASFQASREELEQDILRNENQTRQVQSDVADIKEDRQEFLDEGKEPAYDAPPSKGASHTPSPSKIPKPTPKITAAFRALEVAQTEAVVQEYMDAVGEDKFSPTEYDTLKRIMISGNPEEKRSLLRRLEKMPGGITASYSEQFSSPYSTMEAAGSYKRESAADRRYEGGKRPELQEDGPTNALGPEAPWKAPAPKPGGS